MVVRGVTKVSAGQIVTSSEKTSSLNKQLYIWNLVCMSIKDVEHVKNFGSDLIVFNILYNET